MDIEGYTLNGDEARSMSGFRALVEAILMVLLLAAGCRPSQDVKSTPGATSPPAVVEGVELTFTLTNRTEAGLYVLQWYTPLEGFGGEILCIVRDGQPVPHRGPEVERGDPTPNAYVPVEAGASASTTVDLAAVHDFSRSGVYTVAFSSPRMSHVARTMGEMARSIDELGPVAMPGNQVSVTVLEEL
jgi:hypothetical protein